MKNVCIIATGGTIDKDHDPITERLIFSDHSHVPEILTQCRATNIDHHIVTLKDSLDITQNDREALLQAINAQSETAIVVTHGTSTMAKTAEFLNDKTGDKVVVLTGAMRPFSLFRSDAGFNLGSALVAARVLEPGVYVTMNGQVFKAGHVQKNIKTGMFEAI